MITVCRKLAAALGIAVLLGAAQAVAEPVTITRDIALLAEPRAGAATSAQVTKGATGEAIGKQGPYFNVKTAAGSGWVLTVNVQFASTGASSGSGPASLNRLIGRNQAGSTQATIGIRGFDKDMIGRAMSEGAPVNEQQLAMLDSFAATKQSGETFASSKGLSATDLSY